MKGSVMLQPCIIGGKYVAETNFERKLSMESLYLIAQKEIITDFRCCLELGIAKFYLNGKRIRLDKNGRILISDISNEKEAKIWIKQVKRIIESAFI